jgi:hypothetical protein
MKREYKKFYEVDTYFLKPPTNINNTINNINNHLDYNKKVIDILGQKKINKLKNTLSKLLNNNYNNYDKYYNIDFIELFNMVWRFVECYEPECMCIFFNNIIGIENFDNAYTKIFRIYHFYKTHMKDKDDIFIHNLI